MLMKHTFVFMVGSIPGAFGQQEPPCCVQEEYMQRADVCTTIPYCNENQVNCEGNCEGQWVTSFDLCVEEGASCSPTAPVQCCGVLDCINAVNNVGVCGTSDPVTAPPAPPTGPVPSPPSRPNGSRATYYFGHSLIYHTYTDFGNTNLMAVPFWMNQLALASSQTWFANGEFRHSNYALPPTDQWGWVPDISAWQGSFESSGYNSIVYTELNFVQYQPPTFPYDGDNPEGTRPVDSVTRIIDFVNDPSVPIYIYQCWNGAESLMPGYYPFLGENDIPSLADRDNYYSLTDSNSHYHQWWQELYSQVLLERPGANIHLIEVSAILIDVLRSIYLQSVPFHYLFEDNAPHGHPSVYFLSALIEYMAITGERPSEAYAPPNDSSLLFEIVDNYEGIIDLIAAELQIGSPAPVPPTQPPTESPTRAPSGVPTKAPTPQPSPGVTSSPTEPQTVSPTRPPTSSPTPYPTTPATTSPPMGEDSFCCFQPEIVGADCTTVGFCNQSPANCENPSGCDGLWMLQSDIISTTPAPTPTDTHCCHQEEFGAGCTAVEWCNLAQSNCESSQGCDGTWITTSASEGDDNFCCFQPDMVEDDCTEIDYCNASPENCENPSGCDGLWILQSDIFASTPEPTPADTHCCHQEEIGAGCTTVEWCNLAQSNCESAQGCDGTWILLPNRQRSLRGKGATSPQFQAR